MKRYDDEETTTSTGSDDSDSDSDSSTDDDDHPTTPPPRKNHTVLHIAILLVLLALAAAGFYLYYYRSSSTSATSASSASTGTSTDTDTRVEAQAAAQGTQTTTKTSSETTAKGTISSSSASEAATEATATSATATTTSDGVSSVESTTTSATTASSSASTSTSTSTSLSSNGVKAGMAGGDGFDSLSAHISWWYDWNADDGADHTATGVTYFNMLWGNDAYQLTAFKAISDTPAYILGFNEPDLSSQSGLTPEAAAGVWEELIAPWQAKGSLLGSPAPGLQAGETWLAEFEGNITTMWDFTAAHIYQSTADDVQTVIDHYTTYGKPIFVTEWGCVNVSSGFVAIEDQDFINSYINDCVDLFEANGNIAGYAAIINGSGLGTTWPLVSSDGSLSDTGETYLTAISKYY